MCILRIDGEIDGKVMSRWTLNENKERARTFGRGNEGVNLAWGRAIKRQETGGNFQRHDWLSG